MSHHALFVEAVQAATDLPALLREHATQVRGLEECQFDYSYIEFLDLQIRLSPRGPEWTERLKRRRAALLPFCGVPFLQGRVSVGLVDYTVQINPHSRSIIHWEEYELLEPWP